MIDPARVSEIFRLSAACDEGEVYDGITGQAVLNHETICDHQAEINRMLDDLPAEFHAGEGGGWSFLNLCNDRSGQQWTGFHAVMEHLVLLGIAVGRVSYLLPREIWDSLPGGMPYIVIAATPASEADR